MIGTSLPFKKWIKWIKLQYGSGSAGAHALSKEINFGKKEKGRKCSIFPRPKLYKFMPRRPSLPGYHCICSCTPFGVFLGSLTMAVSGFGSESVPSKLQKRECLRN
jgi:hypothetical protein